MTAFLFISAAAGARPARRVDPASFASLFAEVEEFAAPRSQRALVTRVLALLVIVVIAIGDTLLVAHPDSVTQMVPASGAPASARPAVTNL